MENIEVKRKRRSKEDTNGRVFLCDCGKRYFSHQALYTHIKAKHPNSLTSETLINRKRGRPRVFKPSQNCENLLENPEFETPGNLDFIPKGQTRETCDEIFSEYLMKEKKRQSEEKYGEIKGFILNLRDCINKNTEKIDSNDFFNYDVYTLTERPDLIPNISSCYIFEYLPKENPGFDILKEKNFLFDFCKWLKAKNYTKIDVSELFSSSI